MAVEGQRRIMICVDGSEQAAYAFNWYLKNYKQENDYVYGVIVPEYQFSGITGIRFGPLADPTALSQQFQEQYKKVEKICGDFTAELRQLGLKGQCDSFSGDDKPGAILLEQSVILKADCVVMGTRGLGMIKSFMSGGSVSSYVSANARVPVCVIPCPKDAVQSKGE